LKNDSSTHDGEIRLLSNRRRGVWIYESRLKIGPKNKVAGQAPTTASTHSLLVIALTSSLKAISRNLADKMTGQRKPKLRIIVADSTFIDALKAQIDGDKAAIERIPLRAGKQFLRELARQLSRFSIELVTDQEDKGYLFSAMALFAKRHLLSPRELDQLPAYLLPAVVAQS
jgi:DNA-binding NarL/FixJ family response regulator